MLKQDEIIDELGDFIADLQDAFAESLAKKDSTLESYRGVSDGYFVSHLIRAGVKSSLMGSEYDLQNIPNTGLEVRYLGKYCIKIVRSSHAGDVPAPTTVTRATWCMANQPRLFCDGITPADMWEVRKLHLPGGDSKEIVETVYATQKDGLVHILVDWEEIASEGTVRLALSMPIGAWAPGERPRVAWRYMVEDDGLGAGKFVPSDEPFNVFDDEDEGDVGMGVAIG